MTEKRYGMSNESGAFIDKKFNKEYTDDEIIDLLNELNDKNEQLKARIQYLERKIQRERNIHVKEHEKWEEEIQKENEQLKQFINRLTSRDGKIWLSSGHVYDVKKVLKGDVE